MQVIVETGRGGDFMSVMQGISGGLLDPHNIALHFLIYIKIASFLAAESLQTVRLQQHYTGFLVLGAHIFPGKSYSRFQRSDVNWTCQR